MNASDWTASNPFATRWVRPGAIAYRFAAGQNANTLIDRLRSHAWQGQIVGPHGAGKSTLLATLIKALNEQSVQTVLVALHDGQRSLGVDLSQYATESGPFVVVVDGYEQLGWWSRWRLARTCQRHRWGRLVTAHKNVGLPTLCEVHGELATLQQVVRELLPPGDQTIRDRDVAAEFARQGGNARETLFGLYDLYQQRRLAEQGKRGGATS